MLTQLAVANHSVTGLVGRQEKKDYVRKLGAHKVCTQDELFAEDDTFDVIFVASGKNLDQYYKKLNKNGKLIIYGFHSMVPKGAKSIFSAILSYIKLPKFNPFNLVYENKTISGFNIIHVQPDSMEFSEINKHFVTLMVTGNMPKAHNVHVYELENVNQAINDLASGNVEGKIVVSF